MVLASGAVHFGLVPAPLIVSPAAPIALHAPGQAIGPGPRVTRWTGQVTPDRVLPEYPRPDLVETLRIRPDVDSGLVRVGVHTVGPSDRTSVRLTVLDGTTTVGEATTSADGSAAIAIANPHRWAFRGQHLQLEEES